MNKERMMQMKNLLVTATVLISMSASVSHGAIINGDFEDGLNDWPIAWGDVSNSGTARFTDDNSWLGGAISQVFHIESNVRYLTFELAAYDLPGDQALAGPDEDYDSFLATLIDRNGGSTDGDTLLSNGGEDGKPFFQWWYDAYYETTGSMTGEPDMGTGALVFLDVTSIAGQNVELKFAFNGHLDEYYSLMVLDNVALVVPTPGALLLASLGVGAVGFIRRRFLS